jgi:photosynthetic reaction center H subunit
VLLPMNFARIRKDQVKRRVHLRPAVRGVPGTRSADQVTLLEEEKIMAYYGAGTLYADAFAPGAAAVKAAMTAAHRTAQRART